MYPYFSLLFCMLLLISLHMRKKARVNVEKILIVCLKFSWACVAATYNWKHTCHLQLHYFMQAFLWLPVTE